MTTASPPRSPMAAFLDAGVLSAAELRFAEAMGRLAGEARPDVLLGAALAARAPTAGHVCVDLRTASSTARIEGGEGAPPLAWPEPEAWRKALASSPLVGTGGEERRPLVLHGPRLYLDRYWRYERRLGDALLARAADLRHDVDLPLLRGGLDRLFGPLAPSVDLQRVAAAMAVLGGLTVLSGGPGTGKTTTVTRVLALLQEQAIHRGRPVLRVALVAPTGKAAARLAESIRAQKGKLAGKVDATVLAAIPEEAATLHRRLGFRPDTPTRFRHDADNPLPADVVVADEASMIDLALMTKLVEAVPPHARLLLLGDRDQLASVEAGAILGDVCNTGGPRSAFTVDLARTLREAGAGEMAADPGETGLRDRVIQLTRSHRFAEGGGIGSLAKAINAGDADAAEAVLAAGGEVRLVSAGKTGSVPKDARDRIVEGFRALFSTDDPATALDALGRLRVLCAHRSGRLGVHGMNARVEEWLAEAGLVPADRGEHYRGRPILVGANDYPLRLFNGDTGVLLPDPSAGGELRAWFPLPDGDGVRALHPARIPAHETCYATTIHNSQGSEVDEVVLVLPEAPSRILTRELLYTGVTRARSRVTVVGAPEVLRAGVRERVSRTSGLRERLWGSAQ